ncbi:MAG: hypothetical protein ACRC1V_11020, partial [Plesiomonas sp.]
VPLAMSAIDKLVKMMYGDGIIYYSEEEFAQTGTARKLFLPEVEQFLRKNRITAAWFIQQCWDYRLYANTFSEMMLDKDGKKIVELCHKSAEHCRLSKQNPSNFKIEYMRYSAQFSTLKYPNDTDIKSIPLYRWYEEERFFEWLRGAKFAWHTCLPTPGQLHYARPPWIGLFKECGWLDVASNVPKIVSAMQNNQISIKYQIKISIEYFRSRNPDWDSYTDQQREEKIDAAIDRINSYLTGPENQFKTWSDVYQEDPITHQLFGDIQILPIDDKTKTGTWVPDSNAADAQIVQSLGLHPSQVGLSPEGGKMGAGSGSDQRESFNTQIGLNTMEQDLILEPLNFISRFNGWGVRFMIAHTHHTTTNVKENGLIPSQSTPTPA